MLLLILIRLLSTNIIRMKQAALLSPALPPGAGGEGEAPRGPGRCRLSAFSAGTGGSHLLSLLLNSGGVTTCGDSLISRYEHCNQNRR